MSPEDPAKLPFTRLGRYEVRAHLGDGGMASVYLGRSNEEGREVVALKVIRRDYARDLAFVAMFLDEAKLTSRLSHPNIVKTFEQASEGGHLFIAMELLFGQSLASVWEAATRKKKALPREVVAWIGARVADALQHAHELRDENGVAQEVVHRDINPSNIFVTYGGHVKIIDFGLAKAVDRLTSTVAGVVKGKLAYMSPEQISGLGVDRRADLFSLGTTLWELTCDRRLFKSELDVETMQKVHAAEVPNPTAIVSGYPPALASIVLRALARDRSARYQTGAELAKDLDAFVGTGGRIVTPATLREIMGELFPEEKNRDARWYEGTEAPLRTVPLAPLVLPSDELKTAFGLPAVDAPSPAQSPSNAAPPLVAARRAISEPAVAESPPGIQSFASSSSIVIPGLSKPSFLGLTTAEMAMFGALGMLLLAAIVVAAWALVR